MSALTNLSYIFVSEVLMEIDFRGSKIYFADTDTELLLPFYEFGLVAGFPSPAANYRVPSIDLNMALMIDEENTRLVKVPYDDLIDDNIFTGDLAILDTSLKLMDGDKFYCLLDGEMLFRKLNINNNKAILTASGHNIDIDLSEGRICQNIGVVTYTITTHVSTNIFPNSTKENAIDLNKLLIRNKASTFLGLIKGDSMKEANILNGDLVIVDNSIPYISGYKAWCRIGNKFTVKRLEFDKKDKNVLWLMPANNDFEPIKVTGDKTVEVRGVITCSITPHTRKFRIDE